MINSALPNIPFPIGALLLLLLIVYASSYTRWRTRTRGHPLPPGPPRYPLIGSTFFNHRRNMWEANRDLCNTYGELVYVPVLGKNIMVLGSPRVITDLLDKRSAITSDRWIPPTAELIGQGFNMAAMHYGDNWRRHRRAFWQHFTPTAVARYQETQHAAALVFARKLVEDPSELREHIRYTFAAAVVKTAYGFDLEEHGDPYLARMEKVLQSLAIVTPGRFWVEFIPALRYVPKWFPGAGFQRLFAGFREASDEVREALCERTRRGMESGETSQSVMADLLKRADGDKNEEENGKDVSLVAFEGGADTTFSTLQSFFLAMALHPDVQKKAQAELDSVVGHDRFPTHADRPDLPYIEAVAKESLRWHNVLPSGVSHSTSQDMVYDGYFIPAGTILMPNTWACMHDPTVYSEPTRFLPDRFINSEGQLDPNVRDPAKFIFGYGRRICPGKHFADNSLFINVAVVLHAFDITPALDEHGKVVDIVPAMTNDHMSYPVDCRCTVKPRSEKMKQMIFGHC